MAATIRMSLDRFCAVTPNCRTTSGSRGSAILTRLFTLTVAVSTLVPTSNVTVITNVPLDCATELKNRRFSTPDSCSSIGPATVRVRVSVEAPG